MLLGQSLQCFPHLTYNVIETNLLMESQGLQWTLSEYLIVGNCFCM